MTATLQNYMGIEDRSVGALKEMARREDRPIARVLREALEFYAKSNHPELADQFSPVPPSQRIADENKELRRRIADLEQRIGSAK